MENILALGCRRRLLNGIILSVATVAVAVALVLLSAGPAWFALVFVLAFLAAVMLLQARERT
jgi:uncharacterized membrane protein